MNFFYEKLTSISKKNKHKTAISINRKEINYDQFWNSCKKMIKTLKSNRIKSLAFIADSKYLDYVLVASCLISNITYIPLNKNLPASKIKRILKNTKIDMIFAKNKFTRLRNKKNLENIDNKKIAYIIFTSGSTGEPKGVKISRKSAEHYTKYLIKLFQNIKSKKFMQFANLGFDLSVVDVYGSIFSGSELHVPSEFNRQFPVKFIKEKKINIIVCVPSFVDILSAQSGVKRNDFKSLKVFFFCGETLYPRQLEKLFTFNKNLITINAYGPTEATVSCTEIKLNKKNYKKFSSGSISIGKPIKNMRLKFLTKGKFKEMYIAGPQLSLGYYGEKKLNFDKFKFINGKRYYKTGDLIKSVNSNFYFIKRDDNQIKIKGYRVELSEIENEVNSILKLPVCSIYKNKKIICFVETKKNILVNEILYNLKKKIPHYMIPNKILSIRKIPKNINGKINRRKLSEIAR